ncbi:DUF4145 domain-containing protein [Pseudomonas putida]|uniref:DUF4145 domain-containing protein n=1 Tax=Pseudomonas putida TaxID=303 RepID=UPI003D982217
MSELVANCPRCKTQAITFDVESENYLGKSYNWQRHYELFAICRACKKSTTFLASQRDTNIDEQFRKHLPSNMPTALNRVMVVTDFVSQKDAAADPPPEHLPENIAAAFSEGAACMAIGCYNAGATMFRLCLDLATRAMLPEADEAGLNSKIRRSLGLRLNWLFENSRLPEALRDLSSCVKDDGNDGAHEGILSEEDAKDLSEFSFIMLERIYTEPKRIEIAKQRRAERHNH